MRFPFAARNAHRALNSVSIKFSKVVSRPFSREESSTVILQSHIDKCACAAAGSVITLRRYIRGDSLDNISPRLRYIRGAYNTSKSDNKSHAVRASALVRRIRIMTEARRAFRAEARLVRLCFHAALRRGRSANGTP